MDKRFSLLVFLVGIVSLASVACGSESTGPEPTAQPPSPPPPPAATQPPIRETPTATPSGPGEDHPGLKIAQTSGCTGCHTTDGTPLVGPSWKGLFGKTETLSGGKTVNVDEAYLEESITKPGAKVVDGFSNIMPAFANLTQDDISSLISFIKTLSDQPGPQVPSTPSQPSVPTAMVEVGLLDAGGGGPFEFSQTEFNFSVGETVDFAFNAEAVFHTFTVDDLGINVPVGGGESASLTFTFDKPGTYDLICIPHQSLGMVGTITVQ